MKSKELKEKLKSAEEKVEKIKNTIERHKKQTEKKLQLIRKNEWNENDKYSYKNNDDAYWTICEYENKLEDIKNSERKLKDSEIVASNWKNKLEKQLKLERIYENEMPEIFKKCQIELAEEWTETDIKHKEQMLKQRKELSYDDFRKLYKYSQELELKKTAEEFKKINMKDAELFIIDLFNRVKAITGNVTNWDNIYYGGKALNGFVEGENGKAEVETIEAGGYNIQRYHLRVLVKEINK